MLDYFVYCHNYPVIASNTPPYDFEPVYYNSDLSITESTKSDTETEFINTENNQRRVGAVISEWCSCEQYVSMPTASVYRMYILLWIIKTYTCSLDLVTSDILFVDLL